MNGANDQLLKQQQSIYRQYFVNVDARPGRVRCTISGCNAEIASKKASNLQGHLQNIHKDFYQNIPNNPMINLIIDTPPQNEPSTSAASTSSDLLENEEVTAVNKTTVLSERSRHKLVYQGYCYTFDKKSTDGKINFWRCERKSLGCLARMHTEVDTNEFIRIMKEHDHPRKPLKVPQQVKEPVNKVQVQDEVEESIRKLANSIINKLSNEQSLKRKRESSPCERTRQLGITDEYKLFNNEQFLLADSSDWPSKNSQMNRAPHVLIFGRVSNRLWATQANRIYLEILNSNLPEPFSILCVLWTELSTNAGNVQLFPLTYTLLENEQGFNWMFEALKMLWPQFNPKSVTVDLVNTGSCLLNVVHEYFVDSAIHLSLTSMSQLLKQFVSSTLVDDQQLEDDESRQHCRLLLALVFVPFDKIYAAFNDLTINLSCSTILSWFEAEFIGKLVYNNHRRRPKIAPEVWSCHQRLLNAEMLSNKNAGLIEKRLCSKFEDGKVPTICEWIEALRQFQYFIDLQTEQFAIGVPLDYQLEPEYNEQMFKIVHGFTEDASLFNFLCEISQNLQVL